MYSVVRSQGPTWPGEILRPQKNPHHHQDHKMAEITARNGANDDPRRNERFHLYPQDRLEAFAITAGIVGGFSGLYEGVKSSSLRYLTENGHRLPKTVGGWYFYHKKKNYVMIINGCKAGVKTGAKYSVAVGGFFGLEWFLDTYVRGGTIDMFNTMASAVVYSGLYGFYHRMTRVQLTNYTVKGGFLGLSLGLTQDILRYTRGGDVWYFEKLGIAKPNVGKMMA